MTADKRKYNRIKNLNLQIDIKLRDDKDFTKVEIIDISAGGLSFLSNNLISKNDLIDCKFPFHTKTIAMNGQVVRINGREIGLKFNNLENEIKSFVEIYNNEINSLFIETRKKIPKLVYHESELLSDDVFKKMLEL
jgi:hypothetical protein